jgi:hypothetical protein
MTSIREGHGNRPADDENMRILAFSLRPGANCRCRSPENFAAYPAVRPGGSVRMRFNPIVPWAAALTTLAWNGRYEQAVHPPDTDTTQRLID